jgi:hypothetical protein
MIPKVIIFFFVWMIEHNIIHSYSSSTSLPCELSQATQRSVEWCIVKINNIIVLIRVTRGLVFVSFENNNIVQCRTALPKSRK